MSLATEDRAEVEGLMQSGMQVLLEIRERVDVNSNVNYL